MRDWRRNDDVHQEPVKGIIRPAAGILQSGRGNMVGGPGLRSCRKSKSPPGLACFGRFWRMIGRQTEMRLAAYASHGSFTLRKEGASGGPTSLEL